MMTYVDDLIAYKQRAFVDPAFRYAAITPVPASTTLTDASTGEVYVARAFWAATDGVATLVDLDSVERTITFFAGPNPFAAKAVRAFTGTGLIGIKV